MNNIKILKQSYSKSNKYVVSDPINSSKIQQFLDLVRKNSSMTYNDYFGCIYIYYEVIVAGSCEEREDKKGG